jgi:methyl acetate hydrolase
VPGKRSSGGLS